MLNLFQQATTMIDSLITFVKVIAWVISGMDDVLEMLVHALDSFTDILAIFPINVGEALMGVCGGLFVLRIFGRS